MQSFSKPNPIQIMIFALRDEFILERFFKDGDINNKPWVFFHKKDISEASKQNKIPPGYFASAKGYFPGDTSNAPKLIFEERYENFKQAINPLPKKQSIKPNGPG